MTTATQLRQSKKQLVREFFEANVGSQFSTSMLHAKFGTSFRTRVSELNRDPGWDYTIHNETHVGQSSENSFYYCTRRVRNAALQLEMGLLGGKHENGNVA